MNDVDARSQPTYGGYHAEFRKVHRAKYEKVCSRPGVPMVFTTWWAAELAAWRALRAHLRGEMVRWGDPISMARSEAEKLFPGAIFKRGKRIQVVRK